MFLRVFFLAFLFALDIDAAKEVWRVTSDDSRSQVELGHARLTSNSALPNSCELVASEALRRMERAGVWARILIVRYGDKNEGHALCVYQPHWQIVVYDDTGSVELETNSHDPNVIAEHLSKHRGRPIKSARFLR